MFVHLSVKLFHCNKLIESTTFLDNQFFFISLLQQHKEMGFNEAPAQDFEWVTTDEPHATRRKIMLSKFDWFFFYFVIG